MAEFIKRAKVYTTDTARIRRWRSIDSDYEIVEMTSLYGLPKRVIVVKKTALGEELWSRHRTKEAAEKAAKKL